MRLGKLHDLPSGVRVYADRDGGREVTFITLAGRTVFEIYLDDRGLSEVVDTTRQFVIASGLPYHGGAVRWAVHVAHLAKWSGRRLRYDAGVAGRMLLAMGAGGEFHEPRW